MLNNFKNPALGLLSATLLVSSFSSFAFKSSIEDAKKLKDNIQSVKAYALNYKNDVKRKVVLPISRGFDQKDTGLCWAYGFFDALETLYLVKHPDGQLELSRGAMQFINYEDRTDLTIDGIEDYINPENGGSFLPEGGTAETADYIVKHHGVVPYDEYHDIFSPMPLDDLYAEIISDMKTPSEKRAIRDTSLMEYFSAETPRTVHFNGEELDRFEFAKQILPEGTWTTYALSDDGTTYIDWPNDEDARRNELTYYVPKETLVNKITQSLENQKPVLLGAFGHQTLIYGVDYNENDEPVTLYIKDHYDLYEDGYVYLADFESTVDTLLNITVLE